MSNQADAHDAFTFPGHNDQSKPCPDKTCGGIVEPTTNANVGQCSTCKERYNWNQLK